MHSLEARSVFQRQTHRTTRTNMSTASTVPVVKTEEKKGRVSSLFPCVVHERNRPRTYWVPLMSLSAITHLRDGTSTDVMGALANRILIHVFIAFGPPFSHCRLLSWRDRDCNHISSRMYVQFDDTICVREVREISPCSQESTSRVQACDGRWSNSLIIYHHSRENEDTAQSKAR